MAALNFIFFVWYLVFVTAENEYFKNEFSVEPLILGGEIAEAGQFPYEVSLQKKDSGDFLCGGSIISSRYILTAAHCVNSSVADPQSIVAVVGTVSMSQGGVTVNIKHIRPHEYWNNVVNNIALLRTEKEIPFSDTIQPIALPVQDLPQNGNTPVVLPGWVPTSSNKADYLQFLELETISLENCAKRYFSLDRNFARMITKDTVCTMNKHSDFSCNGDSGGPLVDVTDMGNKSLVGVVLGWSYPYCARAYPNVFTRVYSYVNWIHYNMVD